jgi:peptidyl-prolyl cis-trans isomerase A (cyclophilin A)
LISKIFKLKFTLTLFLAISLVNYVSANEEKIINVTLQTTVGTIHIELYSEKAPISVANFLRYADDGYFNNTSFYRAVRYENDNGSPKIEVIQGGIGDGERAYPMIRHESTNISGLKHLDGTLSMSRGAVDTATSDFFICIGDQSGLDYGASRNSDGLGFAAFGRVTSGMDIVRKIHQMPSDKLTDNSYVKGQLINNPIIIKTIQRD